MRQLFCLCTLALLAIVPAHAKRHARGYARVLPYFERKANLQPGTFNIVDEDDQPVADARVLIGSALNQPFTGNFFKSDNLGHVALPPEWQGPEMVTIEAPGYVRTTYSGITPQFPLTFAITRAKREEPAQLTGQPQQFGAIPKDGYGYFALVTPTLTRDGLFDFDPNTIVSPLNDVIRVFGTDIPVASNVSFPKQRQRYGILPVTIDKPQYRLLMVQDGTHGVVATRARFEFSVVADELRAGKKLYDLFGYFQFLGSGTADVLVNNSKLAQDIPVNQLNFAGKLELRRPENINETALVFAVTLPKTKKGDYIPTDVKRLEPGKPQSLSVPTGNLDGLALGILKPRDPVLMHANDFTVSDAMSDVQISVALKPLNQSRDFEFLPLIPVPRVTATQITGRPPNLPSDRIVPLATYVTLSEIKTLRDGEQTYQLANKVWQFFAAEWQNSQALPQWPGEQPRQQPIRWDISYLATDQAVVALSLGPQMFHQATHAVRNATPP